MTDEDDKPPKIAVLPPGTAGQDGDMRLTLPPDVEGMTLGKALLGQWQYWGLARSIKACRRAVDERVNLSRSVTEFYQQEVSRGEAQARWLNIDMFREAAVNDVERHLKQSQADLTEAERNVVRAQRELEEEQRRLDEATRMREADKTAFAADPELRKRIRQAQLDREEADALIEKEKAEGRLAEVENSTGGSHRQRMRSMERAKKYYAELMAEKEKDIERYGGWEKMPEFLQHMYEQYEVQIFQDGSEGKL